MIDPFRIFCRAKSATSLPYCSTATSLVFPPGRSGRSFGNPATGWPFAFRRKLASVLRSSATGTGRLFCMVWVLMRFRCSSVPPSLIASATCFTNRN